MSHRTPTHLDRAEKTMRIALVSEHASPLAVVGGADAGGQNVHVAGLAHALARLGVEVAVHTRRDDPGLPRRVRMAPGVVVDHIDAGPPEPVPKDELLPHMGAFADALAGRWMAERPHVAHSHFWMSGLATLEAASRVDVPVLHTYHALGAEKRRHQGAADTSPPARLEVEAHIAQTADRVVATTQHEAQTVRAMGARAEDVHVVPCGIDTALFRRGGPVADRPGGRDRIVAASRLVPRKGLADVVRALPMVPGADLVVAGGDPHADHDPDARALCDVAREVGVDDRVTFLGPVARAEMPSVLRSADVVVCCPWYEPFGLVAVEAMACGVPVVATRVGGLAETVVDGVTGVLVRPRDPSSIAHGLRRALGDPALRRRARVATVDRAARFDWDIVAAQTLAIAQDAVATSVAARREVV